MTPVEQFETWRAEIVLELEEAAQTLESERARLAAAELAHREAKAANAALLKFSKDAFLPLWVNNGIAGPLHARLVFEEREATRATSNELGGARAAVNNFALRVNELQDALNQIDFALTAAKVTQLRPAAESARRMPPPIDYDTIQMPLEARRITP